jgi:hypothetical protein
MRRIAFLCVLLTLGGCGYKTWWNPPFTGGYNPNLPKSDSETEQRVLGQDVATKPLVTEPGDIWPGPLPPAPTLKDLENTSGLTAAPEGPVPGSPLSRGTAPSVSPNPSTGSSTPPGSDQPGLAPTSVAPPLSSYKTQVAPSGGGQPSGGVVNTSRGPGVVTGGGPGYSTATQPGAAGQSIIVPNGNGTSTVIHPDGRIETIPTAK